MPEPVTSVFKIAIADRVDITAKMEAPAGSKPGSPGLLLAHGANNDLDHPLLAYLASHLAGSADVAVMRFNFPYVERGDKSPDSQTLLEEAFLAAYSSLADTLQPAGAPVFVGGKSLGGRVAAELVSRGADGVVATGLIELGYPLHAPGRTDRINLKPLRNIDVPSLFCIGSHDPFCDLELLRPEILRLAHPGELFVVEGGDHSLNLPRSSGRPSDDAYEEVAGQVASFIARTCRRTTAQEGRAGER
jgi:hypothetical protein